MAMFKSLAEALKSPESCTTLKLSVRGAELPRELTQLTALRELYLEATALRKFSSELALPQLELLSLKAPELTADVAQLFELPRLRNLKLIETPLKELRIVLKSQMAPLYSLTIKSCGLKVLPLELGEFSKLEELVLPDNELSALPFTFGGLVKLKRLNLDGNAFVKFPDSIKELPLLHHVSIDSNRFDEAEKARIQRQFGLTPS